jgi:diaminopimelate decarboxylase
MADAAEQLGQRPGRAGPPWPASARVGERGLEVGGVAAVDLARRYGTPLLVVDEDELRSRCRAVASAFPRALFAVKAFTAHAVIAIALEEGLDLLAASGGEVEACLRAGAPGGRISLHGNNKSDDELRLAARAALASVVLDNVGEAERLDRIAGEEGAEQAVLLRVIPGVEADTHEAIATGHEDSKFGIPLGEALEAARRVGSLPRLRLAGLHAHVGSQIAEAGTYVEAVIALAGLAARLRDEAGVRVPLVDVGGGFGITYTDERPPSLDDLARAVLEAARSSFEERGLDPPVVAAEPGRWVVGPTAVTLYRVGSRKTIGGRTLLAVDGGMSDNVRPMLYDARYTVALASAARVEPAAVFTIVGRHCESGDVLAEDVSLPSGISAGDVLAFAATGAYTYSMASTYNRVGRPAVVAARRGRATLWLRREDAGDLDRLETGAHRRPPEAEPPPGVLVRPARPGDARSFLAFWRTVVAEGRYVRTEDVRHGARFYRARFRRAWTDRQAQVVAVEGSRVIGHASVSREDHPVTSHVATLGIAVAPDRRDRGIGSALMAVAFRWARETGIEKVILSVYPHNAAAIALYRKFGFVDEGRLARHSRKSYGYEDEILMAAWVGEDRS